MSKFSLSATAEPTTKLTATPVDNKKKLSIAEQPMKQGKQTKPEQQKQASKKEEEPRQVQEKKEEEVETKIQDERATTKMTKEEHEELMKKQLEFEEQQRKKTVHVEDEKKQLNVIFSGHVDHGKSTLSGHILSNLQKIDARQLEKFKQLAAAQAGESWAYAFALDACEEEREKGKTVESARATFTTNSGRRIVLLDSPGHRGFIESMIDSAAQADIGVLVTSARKGEFETGLDCGGQTAEHALILYISGVKQLIVCVNKMDACDYSEVRYNEVVAGLTKYLTSIGFKATNLQFLPASGLTGENLTKPLSVEFPESKLSWYQGPNLLDLIDKAKIPKRDNGGLLRACISGKYKEQGGCVIVCKVEKGTVLKGQKCIMQPGLVETTVSSIEDEAGEEILKACAGENCRICINDAAFEKTFDGSVLCEENYPCDVSSKFVIKLMQLDHPNVLTAGFNAMLHVNTSAVQCEVTKLLAILDPKSGKISEKLPKFAKNGQQSLILVETRTPICISESSYEAFLGRCILRFESATVGIGQIAKLKFADE